MGTVSNLRQCNQDVMLDIDGELAFWLGAYRSSPFHRMDRPFDAYVPTLKFGYDMYLLNYHRPLDQLLPSLSERYCRDVSSAQRLEWPLAEAVVRETWKRMQPVQAPTPHRPFRSAAAYAF